MTYLWTDLVCGLLNRPQVDTLANSARVEKIISLSLDRMKLISIALSTVWKFNGIVRIISYKPHKLSPLLSMRMIGSTLLTFQTCVKQYQKWLIWNQKNPSKTKIGIIRFQNRESEQNMHILHTQLIAQHWLIPWPSYAFWAILNPYQAWDNDKLSMSFLHSNYVALTLYVTRCINNEYIYIYIYICIYIYIYIYIDNNQQG